MNTEFVERATTGFEAYRESVEPWTLDEAERVTGCPAEAIRELAHAYASADRAQLCWTLGITEHHNAVDNVFALINLALLTGHVGRYGSGLQPLRGQNNVQGGGDMGALPNQPARLPGRRGRQRRVPASRRRGACRSRRVSGKHLTEMFEAMEHGELRAALRDRREPGAVERPTSSARYGCSKGSTISSCRTSSSRRRRSSPTSSYPRRRRWGEAEGTVTSSERRVQRVRKALDPPGEARDDVEIVYELAKRLGHDLGSTRCGGRVERAALALADARAA